MYFWYQPDLFYGFFSRVSFLTIKFLLAKIVRYTAGFSFNRTRNLDWYHLDFWIQFFGFFVFFLCQTIPGTKTFVLQVPNGFIHPDNRYPSLTSAEPKHCNPKNRENLTKTHPDLSKTYAGIIMSEYIRVFFWF